MWVIFVDKGQYFYLIRWLDYYLKLEQDRVGGIRRSDDDDDVDDEDDNVGGDDENENQ